MQLPVHCDEKKMLRNNTEASSWRVVNSKIKVDGNSCTTQGSQLKYLTGDVIVNSCRLAGDEEF